MQLEDEELQEMIDAAVAGEAERSYLPLKSRLRLKKELFDSFRRLDILHASLNIDINRHQKNRCQT